MKPASKSFKTILAVLFVGALIFISSVVYAIGCGISGSVKDLSNSQGIQGVIITVKEVRIGTLAGTGTTDASGNYSVGIPALGNYTLVASNPGYNTLSAPDVMELSDTTPNRTVNISMSRKALLKEKHMKTTQTLSWGTDTDKSYIIPALEIPSFIILLNGYDWLAYPNESAGVEKTNSTNLSTFRDHIIHRHGHWGIDRDTFTMNQFNQPYEGRSLRSASLKYLKMFFFDNVIGRPTIVKVRNYVVPRTFSNWKIQTKASYSSIGIRLNHSW